MSDQNTAAIDQAILIIDEAVDRLGSALVQPITAEWYAKQVMVLGRSLLRTALRDGFTTPEQFDAVRRRIRINLVRDEEP